jgi:hypothetical protein
MRAGILEIVGIFVIVVGCGGAVAAAAMVSVALAVLAAALLLILAGVLAVYISAALADHAHETTKQSS